MKILAPTPENLALAAEALSRGEVVGMPTETVYGLAGAAFRPEALARIFEAKERPTFDPLIIHIGPAMLAGHVGILQRGVAQLGAARLVDLKALTPAARERAEALILKFWPGPLTLVLPKHADVPDLATSGLSTVALRMPRHPVAQALIAAAATPLAAPSANRFGRVSPTTAQHVRQELEGRVGYVLDGGPCEIGVESTVVAIGGNGSLALLRPGGIPRAELELAAGAPVVATQPTSPPGPAGVGAGTGVGAGSAVGPAAAGMAAPGMLESHYAPRKPLYLLPQPLPGLGHGLGARVLGHGPGKLAAPGTPLGLLMMKGPADEGAARFRAALGVGAGYPIVARTLSETGDLAEAARRLFATMRDLDSSEAQALFAEPCLVEQGLGHAIADRLRRASKEI